MFNKTLLFVSALFLLFTFSCKDKPASPDIIEYEIKNKPGFMMKITDQGAEPRKLLKFQFKEGLRQTGSMIMDMDIQNQMNGNSSPMVVMPSIVMPISGAVEKVNDDGSAVITYEISDIEVKSRKNSNPELVNSLVELYSKIKLISCSGEVDPFGLASKPECEFKGDIDPSLSDSVKQIMENSNNIVFLPEHPVGEGAKWEISSSGMESGGITVSFKSSQELVSMDGDTASIETTFEQSAGEQTVQFPGNSFETRVESLKGEGESIMQVDLKKLFPTGDAGSKSNITTIIKMPGSEESKIDTHMNMNLKFTK